MTWAKAALIRMTTRLAPLAESDGIRVDCLASQWIATGEVHHYGESSHRDGTSGPRRVLVWWSESTPRLIEWGDRGYRDFVDF